MIPESGRSPGEGIGYPLQYSWASLVAQTVKNLPAMQEISVPSLGWENPLEKEMDTHSSILAWRIPRTEEPGRVQSMGSERVGHNLATEHAHTHTHTQPDLQLRAAWFKGKLQLLSGVDLEETRRIPGTGGAWWAAVYGIAQSRTRLK